MAKGRIAEKRAGGDKNVWKDDGWEVTFQLSAIIEHWQGEGDNGHVE